jgi:hypothetical protein
MVSILYFTKKIIRIQRKPKKEIILLFIIRLYLHFLLISAPGASLSVGVSASLLGACACGVSPAPYFHRSLRAFHSNQQGITINNVF